MFFFTKSFEDVWITNVKDVCRMLLSTIVFCFLFWAIAVSVNGGNPLNPLYLHYKTNQDQIVGVKEFHLAKALLEGHQEPCQCANESVEGGGCCLPFGHCGWSSSSLNFWRYTCTFWMQNIWAYTGKTHGLNTFGQLYWLYHAMPIFVQMCPGFLFQRHSLTFFCHVLPGLQIEKWLCRVHICKDTDALHMHRMQVTTTAASQRQHDNTSMIKIVFLWCSMFGFLHLFTTPKLQTQEALSRLLPSQWGMVHLFDLCLWFRHVDTACALALRSVEGCILEDHQDLGPFSRDVSRIHCANGSRWEGARWAGLTYPTQREAESGGSNHSTAGIFEKKVKAARASGEGGKFTWSAGTAREVSFEICNFSMAITCMGAAGGFVWWV